MFKCTFKKIMGPNKSFDIVDPKKIHPFRSAHHFNHVFWRILTYPSPPPPGKLTWKWKHKYIWVDITPKKRFFGDFSSPISVFWRGVNPFPQVDTKTIGAITLIRSPFFHSPLVSTPLASTSLYSFGHVVFLAEKKQALEKCEFPPILQAFNNWELFFAYKKKTWIFRMLPRLQYNTFVMEVY